MKTLPLVSVVMTVFNGEKYLDEAIDSVLDQTFGDFEFNIADDGSDDGSVELIRRRTDPRISLQVGEHRNYIDLLNGLIAGAKGKYIVKMDQDDRMFPERIEKQYRYMEQHPEIDVCGSWAEVFGDHSFLLQTPITDREIQTLLIKQSPMVHPSVIFRKSSIEKYMQATRRSYFYHPSYLYADDYKLWIDLAWAGWKFANLPEVLLKYRRSDCQITSVHRAECAHLSVEIQKEYMKKVVMKMIETPTPVQKLVEELIEINETGRLAFKDIQLLVADLYRCFLKLQTDSE